MFRSHLHVYHHYSVIVDLLRYFTGNTEHFRFTKYNEIHPENIGMIFTRCLSYSLLEASFAWPKAPYIMKVDFI